MPYIHSKIIDQNNENQLTCLSTKGKWTCHYQKNRLNRSCCLEPVCTVTSINLVCTEQMIECLHTGHDIKIKHAKTQKTSEFS